MFTDLRNLPILQILTAFISTCNCVAICAWTKYKGMDDLISEKFVSLYQADIGCLTTIYGEEDSRERANREAREKDAAEARLKAERDVVQRAQTEARERAAAEAKERAEKAAAEARERT
ncbi:dnaJ domain-containing protein [Artemisia annua]|uniref:DnaJ domain-containing protein n=1 Tax=Artemisia annua TaxID=35608 RepID=A0A2U1L9C9_ARTAN|nr:dnaJ domain-containing protein [Artemisia annua]